MSDAPTDRLPPQDRAAERGVIGGVLRDPDVLPDVLLLVRAESFYFDAHRKLFAALADIAGRNEPVELVGLGAELKRRGELGDVGGAEYLADLWDAMPTGANAVYHAGLVRETATVRALIRIANEALRDAYAPTMSADELLGRTERALFALAVEAAGAVGDPRSAAELVREVMATIDERIASGGGLVGLPSGYQDLDAVTGGFRPGELVVIGARPSTGKTALALNLLARIAAEGAPALLFSLEMPGADIAERLISTESGVPMHRMSRPRELRREDIDQIVRAGDVSGLGGMPLYIADAPDISAAQVAAVARRAVRKYGIRVLAIDYLGLMRPENPRDNRNQQIGTLALRVKQLARSLNVPVLLLSQLNRESDGQQRKPRLSDLRESGDIEAHADRVILLHREHNLPPDDPVWPIDLVVAKNRNGPVGDVRLAYRRPIMRFESHAIV